MPMQECQTSILNRSGFGREEDYVNSKSSTESSLNLSLQGMSALALVLLAESDHRKGVVDKLCKGSSIAMIGLNQAGKFREDKQSVSACISMPNNVTHFRCENLVQGRD